MTKALKLSAGRGELECNAMKKAGNTGTKKLKREGEQKTTFT